jgi:hypothetical protein
MSFEAALCVEDIDVYRLEAPVAAGERFAVRITFDGADIDIDARLLRAADAEPVAESASVLDREVLSTVSDGGSYLLEVFAFEPGPELGAPYLVEVFRSPEAESNCCAASDKPFCSVVSVQDCVCGIDDFCCSTSFDDLCVVEAASSCAAACSVPPPSADCCNATNAPGCSDAPVEACVCALAPFCCTRSYDALCVSLAVGACGAVCDGT